MCWVFGKSPLNYASLQLRRPLWSLRDLPLKSDGLLSLRLFVSATLLDVTLVGQATPSRCFPVDVHVCLVVSARILNYFGMISWSSRLGIAIPQLCGRCPQITSTAMTSLLPKLSTCTRASGDCQLPFLI